MGVSCRYRQALTHFIQGINNTFSLHSSSKEEEVEEYFRKKYADETTVTRHFGDGGEDMTDEITQQTLLPGVKYYI